ncbi:hypothetical protein JHK84_027472 [Glycine max]|nr:hypothetical protein JHK86_027362 [Glycine max]KAG5151000.1 hypothetical protein JHK84_027472 [Glycine max]
MVVPGHEPAESAHSYCRILSIQGRKQKVQQKLFLLRHPTFMFMDKDANSVIQLPPGFRFHLSHEELIVHYLRNKVTSSPIPASFIAEIDLYNYNPWELPNRKYPNGVRPNREATSGYWKATGTNKPIFTSCGMKSITVKKALVFYKGRPSKGSKTNWIMHE